MRLPSGLFQDADKFGVCLFDKRFLIAADDLAITVDDFSIDDRARYVACGCLVDQSTVRVRVSSRLSENVPSRIHEHNVGSLARFQRSQLFVHSECFCGIHGHHGEYLFGSHRLWAILRSKGCCQDTELAYGVHPPSIQGTVEPRHDRRSLPDKLGEARQGTAEFQVSRHVDDNARAGLADDVLFQFRDKRRVDEERVLSQDSQRLERSQFLRATFAAHALDLAFVRCEDDLKGVAACVSQCLGLGQALISTERSVSGAHRISQQAILAIRCNVVAKRLCVGHLFAERHTQSLRPIRRAVGKQASADEPEPERASCLEDLVRVAHRAAFEERCDAAANRLTDSEFSRAANLFGRKSSNESESRSLALCIVQDLVGLTTEQAESEASVAEDQTRKDNHACLLYTSPS